MTGKVLITGSSGLIGSALKQLFAQKVTIHELGRKVPENEHQFQWNIPEGTIDHGAFEGVDTVVHLAGAGVADEKWTAARKKALLDSRIDSTRLLYENLKNSEHTVKTLICASAVGYYGFDRGTELVMEDSEPGEDFLAGITVAWEKEAAKFEELGLRVVNLRIGIVLSTQGGALPEIMKPVKWMAGAALGKGTQYMSWIHIRDMAGLIEYAMNNENLKGIYNAVAPQPESNKDFTKKLAKVMQKPFFLPPVPGFVLKLLVGEMSVLVMGGLNVSSKKIMDAGYSFLYPDLNSALENLINNK